jgi:glycerol uptake facilitator-like aquaporin
MFGGFIASAIVFVTLGGALLRKDELRGIKPGDAASVETAAGFGDYFNADYVDSLGAFGIEALGTGILMFMIFALTDERNPARPSPGMIPFFVGMTVTVLISLFAPLTMAGWNPARDLPPRIIAMLVGYGEVALPGPHGGVWAYSVGPCLGAVIGGFFYDVLIAPGLPDAELTNKEAETPADIETVLPNLLQMREMTNKVVIEAAV